MRFAMKAQGLTQAGVAKHAGCNQSQVSRLLRGQFDDETECLSQVCSVLKIQLGTKTGKSQDTLDRIGRLLRGERAQKASGRRASRLNAATAKRRQAIEQALQSIVALA